MQLEKGSGQQGKTFYFYFVLFLVGHSNCPDPKKKGEDKNNKNNKITSYDMPKSDIIQMPNIWESRTPSLLSAPQCWGQPLVSVNFENQERRAIFITFSPNELTHTQGSSVRQWRNGKLPPDALFIKKTQDKKPLDI